MRNYYGDSFPYDFFDDPSLLTGIGIFLTVLVIIALIAAAINLALYILRSIGLYKLAVNRGMSGAGLAWIPIVGCYRIGSIADDISEREGSRTYFRYFLLAGNIISILFSSAATGAIVSSFTDLMSRMGRYGYSGRMLPGSFIAANAVSSLVSLISLAAFVLTIVALNKVYKCYRPVSSTSWTVLSVIFPFMQSIFLFMIRNSVPASYNNMPPQSSPWGEPAPYNGYYPPQAPPPNAGYPPQPPQFQPQHQPVNPGGYYPPRAPEPPSYQPPQNFEPEQAPPTPPWEGGNPPEDN